MGSLFLTIIGSLIILIPCLILELIHTAVKKSRIQKSGDSTNGRTKFARAKAAKGEVIYISKSDYDYL